MSDSSALYWKTVNKMLRDEELEFNKPIPECDIVPVITLTFDDHTENLKKGIEYALKNVQEVSQLEYDYNNGQPTKITFKQLEWARIFIESSKSDYISDVPHISTVLNAQCFVPIGKFLLECYALIQRKPTAFQILTDAKRKTLISTLFGNESSEEIVLSPIHSESIWKSPETSCVQIILESADVASAIDELIINLSDRTWSPWRIQSVYIEESLRQLVYESLIPERLKAINKTGSIIYSGEENEELAKRFGGNILKTDCGIVNLIFDVPKKYLPHPTNTTFRKISVAINFFRTSKEAIQLVKGDFDQSKKNLTTIWTENIESFYEFGAELNANIIWSNSIGEFDKIMPSLSDKFDNKLDKLIRFETIFFSNNRNPIFQFPFLISV